MRERIRQQRSPEKMNEEYKNASKVAVQGLRRYVKKQAALGARITTHEDTVSNVNNESKMELNLDEWSDERKEYSSEYREFEIFPLPQEILEQYEFLKELPRNVGVMLSLIHI